jgi:hypothetical protein
MKRLQAPFLRRGSCGATARRDQGLWFAPVPVCDDNDMSTDDAVGDAVDREPSPPTGQGVGPGADLQERLEEWAAAGLIDAAHVERITRWEAARRGVAPVPRRSVVVEALAYVGGAVIAAALVIVAFGYWDRFDRATHIAIPAAATAMLLIAGLATPRRLGAVGVRVRATVWLVSVATCIGLLVVLVDVPSIAEDSRPMVVGGGAAIYALALWLVHRTVLQHAAAFGAVEFFAVSVVQPVRDAEIGIGVVMGAVALAWGLAAWRGLLPGLGRWLAPASPASRADAWAAAARQRDWGIGLAAIGLTVSAVVLSSINGAPWIGLLPVLVILAVAIALGNVGVVVIGAIAALIVIPAVVDHYLHSTLAVALVLLATGAVMVLLAVLIVRRRGRITRDSPAVPGSATGVAAWTSSSTRSDGSAPG